MIKEQKNKEEKMKEQARDVVISALREGALVFGSGPA